MKIKEVGLKIVYEIKLKVFALPKLFLGGLLFTVFLLRCPVVIAQENISIQQTLDYINNKFNNNVVVSINYGVIIATYNEGGNKYREDQCNIKDLDADKVVYNPKTKMLLLNCKSPTQKCITREFLEKRLYYNRISFELNASGKTIDGLVHAFKHLIRSVNEKNYKSAEPFE
jgi:hypothetical protein